MVEIDTTAETPATNLRLTKNLEAVLADEFQQLAVSETEEFLHLGHLRMHDEKGGSEENRDIVQCMVSKILNVKLKLN